MRQKTRNGFALVVGGEQHAFGKFIEAVVLLSKDPVDRGCLSYPSARLVTMACVDINKLSGVGPSDMRFASRQADCQRFAQFVGRMRVQWREQCSRATSSQTQSVPAGGGDALAPERP